MMEALVVLAMFDRNYRNQTRCAFERGMIRVLMLMAMTRVIFCDDLANGSPETALERPPLKVFTPISTVASTMATLAAKLPGTTKICGTPECRRAASMILANMNPNVDPCDNFYEYACGGFDHSEPKSSTSTVLAIEKAAQEQMQNGVKAKSEADEPKYVRLAKNVYKSCINEAAIEAREAAPHLEHLEKLGGWPVLVGDSWNADHFDWKNTTYELRKAGYAFDNLIALKVEADDKKVSRYALALDRANLGIAPEFLTEGFDDPIISTYYNFMVDVATTLGANEARARKELRESLNLEVKLAEISLARDKCEYMTDVDGPLTLGELSEEYENVPWKEYFRKLLPQTAALEEDEAIFVYGFSYISNLVKLIDETEKRVLANYLMWRATQESLKYLNDEMRRKEVGFSIAVPDSTESLTERENCFNQLYNALPTVLDGMYVRQYSSEDAKKSVASIATDVRERFTQTIRNTTWMDDETRRNVLSEIEALVMNLAYPDELLDVDRLESVYGKLELSEDDYFENVLTIRRFKADRDFGRLGRPLSETFWDTNHFATDVNGFFFPKESGLNVPAGLLQGITFHNDRPRYMNYGALGSTIAGLMIFGFVTDEGLLQEDGLWTLATKKKYHERLQCLNEQYPNYTVEEAEFEESRIDSLTIDIAADGGFKLGYDAYTKWFERHGPESRLPGIDSSPNQLFWLSAVNMWCAKSRPDVFEDETRSDAYILDESKIILALRNSKEFSEDFNCPIDSQMNPTKKCSIW